MFSMTSCRTNSFRILRPLLAACILAGAGGATALAADLQDSQTPPPQAGAMQGSSTAPGSSASKKATCSAEAKTQGLKGQQRQQFIDQCMHG